MADLSPCAKIMVLVIVLIVVILLQYNKSLLEGGRRKRRKQCKSRMKSSSSDGTVTLLDGTNAKDAINSNELVFVKFYAPWCRYCVMMEEEWKRLAAETAGDNVVIAEFDASKERPEAVELTKGLVQGFPTLVLFVSGKPHKYEGDRTVDKFKSYIRSKAR